MATTSLRRTPSSAGSNTTATVSVWVKIDTTNNQGSYHCIIGGNEGSSSTDRSLFAISNDGTIYNQIVDGGTNYYQDSSVYLRDPTAWYHIVFQFDTSNATEQSRVKTYVNNQLVTSWGTSASWPQNVPIQFWNTSNSPEFLIGCRKSSANYQYFFNGSMAHMYIIDGTVYAPSKFAETDATTGEWVPIATPTGITYGTNGSLLKFEDKSNMALDSSGNDLSYTTTGSLIQTQDNPQNNFATLHTLAGTTRGALDNASGTYTTTSTEHGAQSTLGMAAGKWYWECKIDDTSHNIGLCENPASPAGSPDDNFPNYNVVNTGTTTHTIYNNPTSGNNSTTITATASAAGDIINMAYDADNGFLYYGLNGTWLNSGDPTSGATGTGAIVSSITVRQKGTIVAMHGSPTSSSRTFHYNFGNGYFGTTAVSTANSDGASIGLFEYAVPTGYYALCTKNLATYG